MLFRVFKHEADISTCKMTCPLTAGLPKLKTNKQKNVQGTIKIRPEKKDYLKFG